MQRTVDYYIGSGGNPSAGMSGAAQLDEQLRSVYGAGLDDKLVWVNKPGQAGGGNREKRGTVFLPGDPNKATKSGPFAAPQVAVVEGAKFEVSPQQQRAVSRVRRLSQLRQAAKAREDQRKGGGTSS